MKSRSARDSVCLSVAFPLLSRVHRTIRYPYTCILSRGLCPPRLPLPLPGHLSFPLLGGSPAQLLARCRLHRCPCSFSVGLWPMLPGAQAVSVGPRDLGSSGASTAHTSACLSLRRPARSHGLPAHSVHITTVTGHCCQRSYFFAFWSTPTLNQVFLY